MQYYNVVYNTMLLKFIDQSYNDMNRRIENKSKTFLMVLLVSNSTKQPLKYLD